MPEIATPRPAATVLVLRDTSGRPEVFMVRRHAGIPFMGGAFVFPGGAVDERDADAAGPSWAFHAAAIRELFEEAGILLARDASDRFVTDASRFAALRDDLHAGRVTLAEMLHRERLRAAFDVLTPFAHWVTPAAEARRYDTKFFVTPMPPGQMPVHDAGESTEGRWITPHAALDAARKRTIALPPPTWVSLEEIEPFGSVEALLVRARDRFIERRQPELEEDERGRRLIMPDKRIFSWSDGHWQPWP